MHADYDKLITIRLTKICRKFVIFSATEAIVNIRNNIANKQNKQ